MNAISSQEELDRAFSESDLPTAEANTIIVSARYIDPGTVYIFMKGEPLDFIEGSQLIGELCGHLKQYENNIILDLSLSPYLSSIGIGSIAGITKHLIPMGYKISLLGFNQDFRDMLEMANLDNFLILADSIEEAIERMKSAENQMNP